MTGQNSFEFDWDEGNSTKSWIKHKVSIKEQEEAFYDINAKRFDDPKHSTSVEDRYLLFAQTKNGRKLVIAFTIREEKIRAISARPMNRREVSKYEETIKIT